MGCGTSDSSKTEVAHTTWYELRPFARTPTQAPLSPFGTGAFLAHAVA